jgi:prepilin-type N-terminal cleavage/methylation domain-containing protein
MSMGFMKTTRHAGFTLVEVMMVVGIIGLLAAIALPTFAKARTQTRSARFIADLRVAAHAFDTYATFAGDYPPDVGPGQVPVGMDDYLAKVHWSTPTSIGGRWDWDFAQHQFGVRAGVSVYRPNRSDAEMAAIDMKVDDGDLATGMFRKRSQGYIYVLEE